jgi:hypothetical protein
MIGGGDISGNGNTGTITGTTNTMPASGKHGLMEANVVWTPNKDFQMVATTMRATSDAWKYNIWSLGTKVGLGSDLSFTAEYAHNSHNKVFNASQRNAWFAQLGYKGATRADVGSFGLFLNYKKYGNSSVDYRLQSIPIFEAINDAFTWENGARGWGVGFNYTFAKNAIFTLTYEDLKAYQGTLKHGAYTYAQVNLFF